MTTYTVYATDADNDELNEYGDYNSFRKAKKVLKEAIEERGGFGHGKIVDGNGQILHQHKYNL